MQDSSWLETCMSHNKPPTLKKGWTSTILHEQAKRKELTCACRPAEEGKLLITFLLGDVCDGPREDGANRAKHFNMNSGNCVCCPKEID